MLCNPWLRWVFSTSFYHDCARDVEFTIFNSVECIYVHSMHLMSLRFYGCYCCFNCPSAVTVSATGAGAGAAANENDNIFD